MSTAQVEGESTAAQLIDALLAGGQPVDEGSFSLDTAAAAAKLDAYQYADRSTYLIPIAEAAGGLGARKVTLTTHGEDLLITFETVALWEPEAFLADPFAQPRGANAERSNRALGRLGVGIHMALGHAAIERIAVSYSSLSEMIVAEYRRDTPVRLVRRDPEFLGELRIFIDRRWTERLSLRGACHAELEHLRRAVEHSPHAFEIDGRSISGQPRDWDYATRSSAGDVRYESGLEQEGERASVIELWSEGVCVDTLSGPGIAFRAALHLEAPHRDLSQMKIVRDEHVDAALKVIETTYRETLATLAEHDAAWANSQRPSHWPEARVDRVLGRPVRQPKPGDMPVVRGMGFTFGLVFYLAGILAGTIAFAALASRHLWGLFVLIFLFSHGGMGASTMAKSLRRDPQKIKVTTGVLFGFAFFLALWAGLVIGIEMQSFF